MTKEKILLLTARRAMLIVAKAIEAVLKVS